MLSHICHPHRPRVTWHNLIAVAGQKDRHAILMPDVGYIEMSTFRKTSSSRTFWGPRCFTNLAKSKHFPRVKTIKRLTSLQNVSLMSSNISSQLLSNSNFNSLSSRLAMWKYLQRLSPPELVMTNPPWPMDLKEVTGGDGSMEISEANDICQYPNRGPRPVSIKQRCCNKRS